MAETAEKSQEQQFFFHNRNKHLFLHYPFDIQEQAMWNAVSAIQEKVQTIANFYISLF